MKNVKIAILDNGVDEAFLKKPLDHKVFITENGECLSDDHTMEHTNFRHGTTCAMLIEKYFPEGSLSSVKVLKEDGTGLLMNLRPAMEWCLQHQINIINLSLGTTHFQDKDEMRNLINEYAVKGLVIIAATSNREYLSYPASLSNVIGVAIDRNEYSNYIENRHLGIDVMVSEEHELIMLGEKIITSKCNSYAAPYITALTGKLYLDNPLCNICELKRILPLAIKSQGIYFQTVYNEPDWIRTALIKATGAKSGAEYYFETAEETAEDWMSSVDTVVTDKLTEIRDGSFHDKNIVYLGNEKIEPPQADRFFWHPQDRLRQILSSTSKEEKEESEYELDIPVILCEWEENIDEIFLLSELRKSFDREEYHIYTVSFRPESVLYDLEYIPEEVLKPEHISFFYHFIYWQTHYKQNNAVLMGLPPELIHQSVHLQDKADVRIIFRRCETGYQAVFLYEDVSPEILLLQEIDIKAIQIVFQKIKEVLGE